MRLARFATSVVKNRRRAVPRPSWLTYLVTYRCNARCGMCDSWRLKPGRELSVDEARAALRAVGPLDVVRLSGGEPFLREDFAELARAVLEECRPLVLHVTTNGSFPERVEAFARGFPRRSRLQFLVSFDGLEATHDASRGARVTFRTAVETCRRLTALGFKVAANHTVVNARSLEENAGLRATLEPMGVFVQSVLAYADSAMYTIRFRGKKAEALVAPRGYPLHPSLQGADVTGFVRDELARTRATPMPERLGKRYYLRGLLARLEGAEDPRPAPPCAALRSHVRLLPDGRVPVCQFNTEAVGDLSAQPFDEVWRGPKAREQRSWVDACAGCWAECEVMPSALYSLDPALLAPAHAM